MASENSMHRHPHVITRRTLSLTAFAVATLAIGSLTSVLRADTITVCPDGSCDFTNPVAAVNAAVAGDTIEIAAGTYMLASTISLVNKQLVIRGAVDAAGNPAAVLSGGGTRQVFSLIALAPSTSIENLVITNGRADYGGAIFFYGADVVFRNCAFRNNRATFHGGALYLNDSSPMLIDCEFTDNLASNAQSTPQGAGGAIFVSSGTLTLNGCSLSANASSYTGGAIFLSGGSNGGRVNLESTRICGNSSPNGPQIGMNAGGIVTDLGGACISNNCGDCPVAPMCPADLDADGAVGAADLSTMLASWGACGKACAADIDGDGLVNAADLSALLVAWGVCR
jgi:predicted outer membrane repeat protein